MGKMVSECVSTRVHRAAGPASHRDISVYKVQIKNNSEDPPLGPGHFHLCSVSFSSRHPRADAKKRSQLHPGPRQLLKGLLRERRGRKVRTEKSQQGWVGYSRFKSQGSYSPYL